MIGTATSSLCAFSSDACPPKLKMPTLKPVFPRFRVGIGVAGGASAAVAVSITFGSALEPSMAAVITPPLLRNARRLLFEDCEDEFLRMIFLSAGEGIGSTLPHRRRRVNDLRTYAHLQICSVSRLLCRALKARVPALFA